MSTDEVYGSVDDDESPREENALFAPSNPYAATKAAAEMICHAYMKSFNVPIIITRCNNAISKYQNEEKLIPRTIQSIITGAKVPIHGDGKSKRTFIHSYDIADALRLIAERGVTGKTYNIGTTDEYSVVEVVCKILAILKPGAAITDHVVFQADRPFQDYRYCINTTELQKLGWEAKISFDDALKHVIEFTATRFTKGGAM